MRKTKVPAQYVRLVKSARFAECLTPQQIHVLAVRAYLKIPKPGDGILYSRPVIRPTVRYTRHGVCFGTRFIKLTGLTMAQGFARLWDFLGDRKKADKIHTDWLRKLPSKKRVTAWTPGRAIT